jgi:hypothetical protein
MAGNETLGTATFELLLQGDKRVTVNRRPKISVREIPDSDQFVVNFGGLGPPVLKGTLYTDSDGAGVEAALNAVYGEETNVTFRGRTGRGILTVLDNVQHEHFGDRMWASVEILMTRW